jgi:hypothetical protein
MSLLDDKLIANIERQVNATLDSMDDVARVYLWGPDGSRVPLGMTRLEGQDAQVFKAHLARQSHQEQTGTMPGDAATRAIAAVQTPTDEQPTATPEQGASYG